MPQPTKEYFFISDIHIGGTGVLKPLEIEKEFNDFLQMLIRRSQKNPVELIINGDFFNLWDMAKIQGTAKFESLLKKYPHFFQSIQKAAQHFSILLLPGNHDHDLVCFKEYPALLKKIGLTLLPQKSYQIKLGSKLIWIEHGFRFCPFNNFQNFSDPNETPPGKHITELVHNIVLKAEKHTKKHAWLSDIPFFTFPFNTLPNWFISNYFYHELAMLLRIIIAPAFILFFLSFLVFIIAVLIRLGIIDIPNIFYLTALFGPIKYLVNIIIVYNLFSFSLLVILWLLWLVLKRDILKNLKSYGVDLKAILEGARQKTWDQKIRLFIQNHPQIDLFIYGHFHNAHLKQLTIQEKPKIIINLGTWIKQFQPIKSFFLLPNLFIPFYSLPYLHIYKKDRQLNIQFHFIEKPITYRLTPLQKFSILFKKRTQPQPQPDLSRLKIQIPC